MCHIRKIKMPGAAVADVPPQLVMVVQGDDPQEPPLPLIDLDALTSGSESSEIAFGEDDTSTMLSNAMQSVGSTLH